MMNTLISRILPACLPVLAMWILPMQSVVSLPATDPEYTGPPINFNGLEDKHPRLFFDPVELAELKAFHDSAEGAGLRSRLASQAGGFNPATLTVGIINSESAAKSFGINQMPSIGMHYLLTGSQTSLNKGIEALQFILDLSSWSGGSEPNYGMPAGNILTGAAVAYDMLYDGLDPEFREQVRARIWHQARLMYHDGFLSGGYWQEDPQNNHRFFRISGLALAVIATYTGDPSEDWLLSKAIEEIDFVMRWLPPDGSNHEGISYIGHGMRNLLMTALVSDHVLNTRHLGRGYFKNVPLFILSSTTPELGARMTYADDGPGGNAMGNNYFIPVHYHGLADVQAFIEACGLEDSGSAWLNFLNRDPKPTGGSMDNLPRNIHFPDLGVSFFHERWGDRGMAALFKCGPMGGLTLNEYRDTNDYHYINIAHDDPDANSFVIWERYTRAAESDGYSHHKQSSAHNTILVNHKGQTTLGEPEGMHWSQPTNAAVSMKDMAYTTNWKNREEIALIEGEAANSYPQTVLSRFRRAFIWNNGKYILVFDDIRTSGWSTISWLFQSQQLNVEDEANGVFIAKSWNGQDPFQIKSDQSYNYNIVYSTAEHQGGSYWYRQLQAEFTVIDDLQVACLVSLWDTSLDMVLTSSDADHATLTITGDSFEDVWTWEAAPDDNSPGAFTLTSTDGQTFSAEPDPWLQAIPGFSYDSQGWIVSNWFDSYNPDHFPWIHHLWHGWLYVDPPVNEESSGWLWHSQLGWLWTDQDLYPWFYQPQGNRWLWSYTGPDAGGKQWFVADDSTIVCIP